MRTESRHSHKSGWDDAASQSGFSSCIRQNSNVYVFILQIFRRCSAERHMSPLSVYKILNEISLMNKNIKLLRAELLSFTFYAVLEVINFDLLAL